MLKTPLLLVPQNRSVELPDGSRPPPSRPEVVFRRTLSPSQSAVVSIENLIIPHDLLSKSFPACTSLTGGHVYSGS